MLKFREVVSDDALTMDLFEGGVVSAKAANLLSDSVLLMGVGIFLFDDVVVVLKVVESGSWTCQGQ